ncbi:MAG TPA: N-6 DNA methylase [Alphaproteobacteria bacterium]|nr:N-6 DNA methylase [Alphaproteobacteria bacterium]
MGLGRRTSARCLPGNSLESFGRINHEIARSITARVSEGNGLAFAHSFTFAIVAQCWRSRRLDRPLALLPETVERAILTSEAADVAERLGIAIAALDARSVTHIVGTVYTTALPDAYRGKHGIFYTPPELVEHLLTMAEEAGIDWRKARVLDPACGCGAFLVPIATRIATSLQGTDPRFVLQHIGARLRGYDIDPFGGWLAQAMLEIALASLTVETVGALPRIVKIRDSLDISASDREAYDLVVGNPPFGRVSLPAERRALFARSVYGHANLYGLFTDAALHWAKRGGVIGYVTPTSMLSGLYYKALRSLLSTEAPPQAIDFVVQREGVFADVLQETMLTTYRRGGSDGGSTVGFLSVGANGQVTRRKAGTIVPPSRAEAPWLLPRSAEQRALTRRLRWMPHRLADYGYRVSTGPLVWNRFKAQFRDQPMVGCLPVIWAESVSSDGRFVWRSEKRNHAPWFALDLPKDDWLVVEQPCVLVQRTTAKEQARRLIAAELPRNFIRQHKGVTIENHLNMVYTAVPRPEVPTAVIAALLKSAAVDTAFRCINGSVAVSAFELEELPLPGPPVMSKLRKLVLSGAPVEKIEREIAKAYRISDATCAD